jgi:hypothetical protein
MKTSLAAEIERYRQLLMVGPNDARFREAVHEVLTVGSRSRSRLGIYAVST